MKEKVIMMIVQLIIKMLTELFESIEKREKEISDEKVSMKKDGLLADAVRKQYPHLTDEAILKELC